MRWAEVIGSVDFLQIVADFRSVKRNMFERSSRRAETNSAMGFREMRFVNARIDDLNALRHRHSLAPVRSVSELVMAADRLLILTSPAFDYPGPVPANARWASAITDPGFPSPAPRSGVDAAG